MPTVNEELLERAIAHQIGIQRLSAGVVRRIIGLLNQVDDDLVQQLIKYDPTAVSGQWSQRRLEVLLESVRAIQKEAYQTVGKELNGELKGLAGYEGEFQGRMLQSAIPVDIDIVKPSSSQLFAAVTAKPFQGKLLKEFYNGLATAAQVQVRDAIRIGFVEGETIDQMVRRVRGTRARQFRDGVLDLNRRQAQAVVRTAVNHTANVARSEVFRQNASVIKAVKWVATLDSKTSPICRKLDSKVFPVDSGPRPPQHWNCRSSVVGVVKSWREMGINLKEAPVGTRASMDGQVAANMNYNDWLKTQSVKTQNDVLGKKKAQLFRKGGVTMDRYTDRTGHYYTLDELKAREAEAWGRTFPTK